jgi:hypothetical protein
MDTETLLEFLAEFFKWAMIARAVGINAFLNGRDFTSFGRDFFHVRIHIAVNFGNRLIRLIRNLNHSHR